MAISRHAFALCDAEIKNYEKTRRALEQQYSNIALMRGNKDDTDVVVQTSSYSDPTAQSAMKIMASNQVRYLEWLCDGIGGAMEKWREDELILYDLHYKGRKTPEYIMDTVYWSRRKYYYIRKKMVESVARELGMV